MSRHTPTSLLALCLLATLSFAFAPSSQAQDNAHTNTDDTAQAATTNVSSETSEATEQNPETQSETSESVQVDVEKSAKDDADEKKKTLVKDAVSAVEMTRDALKALEDGKSDEALKTLEGVTGKLELVLARSPGMSYVPVAVTTKIYDVFAETKTVETIVEEAEDALKEGRVQDARRMLDGLASEVVLSTNTLPMATYPAAIKAVAPLIDDGKIDEAKDALELALRTLVVTEVATPLPTTRANIMLDEAEQLAEKSSRSEDENKRLDDLLKEVRHQVEFGKALGYFTSEKSDAIYNELEKIEEKTGKGKSGKDFFKKVKGFFQKLDW